MKPINKTYMNVFSEQVGEKAKRKLNAEEDKEQSIWIGLGTMGIVGWSIVVPTLLGVAFGVLLDKVFQVSFSCTLIFLVFGLILGCRMAWNWIIREDSAINQGKDKK